MRKYVLDTNVFVRADRDPAWGEQLAAFYAAFLPFTYLHAVVVQELLLGAIDARRERAVYEGYVKPFESRGRLLTPSYRAWRRSGQVIATLVRRRRPVPAVSDGPSSMTRCWPLPAGKPGQRSSP